MTYPNADKRQNAKPERNAEIVRLYTSREKTMEEIAVQFGITRARVNQILKRSHIKRNGWQKSATARTAFLGILVHPDTKNILVKDARKLHLSQSSLLNAIILDYLRRRGYEIKIYGSPLPEGVK